MYCHDKRLELCYQVMKFRTSFTDCMLICTHAHIEIGQ